MVIILKTIIIINTIVYYTIIHYHKRRMGGEGATAPLGILFIPSFRNFF